MSRTGARGAAPILRVRDVLDVLDGGSCAVAALAAVLALDPRAAAAGEPA